MTRQAERVQLETYGVSGFALDILLDEGAERRHRERMIDAAQAAEAYVLKVLALERDEMFTETLVAHMAAIMAADVIGVGGRWGVEGLGSERHPAFRVCGSGKKHAGDGGAWSAAILACLRQYGGQFVISNGFLAYEILDCQLLADVLLPVAWRKAVAVEGLRRATGQPSKFPQVAFGDVQPSKAASWAALVNEAVISKEI